MRFFSYQTSTSASLAKMGRPLMVTSIEFAMLRSVSRIASDLASLQFSLPSPDTSMIILSATRGQPLDTRYSRENLSARAMHVIPFDTRLMDRIRSASARRSLRLDARVHGTDTCVVVDQVTTETVVRP